MPGQHPELPDDAISTLNGLAARSAEAFAALQPPPAPMAERFEAIGRALAQDTGVLGYDAVDPGWRTLVPPRFQPFKTYREMAEAYEARRLPVPPPAAYDPWTEDVATRLDSALFATAQGWDWEWDQPGIYNRRDGNPRDAATGIQQVMGRIFGVRNPHPMFAIDVDEPIPYMPTDLD